MSRSSNIDRKCVGKSMEILQVSRECPEYVSRVYAVSSPLDNASGVRGFQPKSRNRAAGARLRARRRKRLREAMEGVGGVWGKRWWWWLVRPFDNASGVGGFEAKSRNGATGGRLRARRRKRLREAMEGVGGVWGKRWWWWLVRLFDNAS